ncbi:unnamed protein product [Coregonus sp. 'balchen']|nr:unnamed protein product [Coregonus sp. 'balchen']
MKDSQSTESQYFSRPAAETRDELNSSTMTKRSSLQKIARHANARPQPETQPLPCGSILGRKLHSEQSSDPQPLTGQPSLTTEAVLLHGHPTTSTDPTVRVGAVGGVGLTERQQASVLGLPGNTHPSGTVLSQDHHHDGESVSPEDKPSMVPGEDPPPPHPPRAKRVCLGRPVACSSNELITPTHSAESSNPLPPPPLSPPHLPLVKSSTKTESKAFPAPAPAPALSLAPAPAASLSAPSPAPLSSLPDPALSPAPAPGRTQSQTSQTTVKVELLTPGKQSQSLLPLTSSNNTEQTNQNSPAASLRGRSVKDVVSSAWSIASTYTDAMGEREETEAWGGEERRRERREGRGREVKRGKIMEGRERKRGDEGKDNGGKESRRGEERRSEERENVARPSRLRRLKKWEGFRVGPDQSLSIVPQPDRFLGNQSTHLPLALWGSTAMQALPYPGSLGLHGHAGPPLPWLSGAPQPCRPSPTLALWGSTAMQALPYPGSLGLHSHAGPPLPWLSGAPQPCRPSPTLALWGSTAIQALPHPGSG